MKNIRYFSLLLLSMMSTMVWGQIDLGILRHSQGAEICRFDSIRFGNIHQYPFEVEAENKNGIMSFGGVGTANHIVVSDFFKDKVSGAGFLQLIPTATTSSPTVSYYCQRPGGLYDVYVTLVPDYFTQQDVTSCSVDQETGKVTVNGEEATYNHHKVRATIQYWDPATSKYATKSSSTLDFKGSDVETLCFFQDIELPMLTFEQEVIAYGQRDDKGNGTMTLKITSAMTPSDRKNGYTNDFCIDKIIFVPKATDTGAKGITLCQSNAVLGIPQEDIRDLKMGGIDLSGVKTEVNPMDFTDVKMTGKIDGMGFMLQEGITPTFGVQLTSMRTVDARGIVYSTDYKANSQSPFYNFDLYSKLPLDEKNGTMTKDADAVVINQSLPALLPNSTVGYVPYLVIGDKTVYGDTCYFHTPNITAEMLNLKVSQTQGNDYCDLTFDASALENGMKRVAFPENPAAPVYGGKPFVMPRKYSTYYIKYGSGQYAMAEEREAESEDEYYRRSAGSYTMPEDTLANGQYAYKLSFARKEPSGKEYLNLQVSLPDFAFKSRYSNYNTYARAPYDYYYSNDQAYALCYNVVAKVGSDDVNTAQYDWKNPSDTTFQDATVTLYAELQKSGEFTNYLRLTRDADVKKVDGKTLEQHLNGNKKMTLAVANDEAWNKFYARNAQLPASDYWHNATSYDKLTKQQKNELAWNGLMDYPVEAALMSAADETAATVGRTILRDNINSGVLRFTEQGDKMLASDLQSTFVNYTEEYLQSHNITAEDYKIITGHDRAQGDVHINDARMAEADGVCSNGYLDVMENVITPLATMDDVIRNNGQCTVFAHIMDRWVNYIEWPEATQSYKELYGDAKQIYAKRYDRAEDRSYLKWDPTLRSHDIGNLDMLAMCVPTDEAMMQFFSPAGQGWPLFRAYVMKKGTADEVPYVAPKNKEELCGMIDNMPSIVLSEFVRHIMYEGMSAIVPSKMPVELRSHVKSAQQACNGVVYYTDQVFGPELYTSILGSSAVGTESQIMNWVLNNGSTSETDYMQKDYYASLGNMQNLTFFLPTDEALKYYYNTISFTTRNPDVIQWSYTNGSFPLSGKAYLYSPEDGVMSGASRYDTPSQEVTIGHMIDVVENSVIVNDNKQNINGSNEYFETLSGDVVKVKRQNGNVVSVQGGFQLENEANHITGDGTLKGLQNVNVTDQMNATNGVSYVMDSPIIPASKSAYGVLSTDPEFSKFFELLEFDPNILRGYYLSGAVETIFTYELDNLSNWDYAVDYNVSFFNNNPYTLYVPTNAAMEKAFSEGLPTWKEIESDLETSWENGTLSADSMRIVGKIDKIMRVVKAHFHFDHAMADKEAYTQSYETPYIYDNLSSPRIKVSCQGNGQMTVTDSTGKTCHVTNKKNIIVRDVYCTRSPYDRTSISGISKVSHSCGVIHQIDGVLGIK